MSIARLAAIAALVLTTAQAPPEAGYKPIDPRPVVDKIADILQRRYPIPAVAAAWSQAIRTNLAQRHYGYLRAPGVAARISEDLDRTHHDGHLVVYYDPKSFAELTNRDHPVDPVSAALSRPRTIHGVRQVEVDEASSTTYITSEDSWNADDATLAAISGAMAVAASSRNVVLDLRTCGGGNGAVGRYWASYFFKPGERHFYLDGYYRDGEREQEWTLAQVPGQTLPDVRLYILAGPSTGSACEGFVYAMQQMHRGIVVGDQTRGAGMAATLVPISQGIVMLLPVKMIVAPHTDHGWEGTGITPDVPANGGDARAVATYLIVQDMAKRAGGAPVH